MPLDEVIEMIVNKGRRTTATPGDVSEGSAVIDMIQSTVKTLGSLDVVRFSNNLPLSPTSSPPLVMSRLDIPARHGLLNVFCVDTAHMQTWLVMPVW